MKKRSVTKLLRGNHFDCRRFIFYRIHFYYEIILLYKLRKSNLQPVIYRRGLGREIGPEKYENFRPGLNKIRNHHYYCFNMTTNVFDTSYGNRNTVETLTTQNITSNILFWFELGFIFLPKTIAVQKQI